MELILLFFLVIFLTFLYMWPILLSVAYYVYSKKQKAKFFLLKSTLTGYAIYLTWYAISLFLFIFFMKITYECHLTIPTSKNTYHWPSGDIFTPCSYEYMLLVNFLVKHGDLFVIPILVFIHYWLVFKFFITKKN